MIRMCFENASIDAFRFVEATNLMKPDGFVESGSGFKLRSGRTRPIYLSHFPCMPPVAAKRLSLSV
ncbi:hypothetical protein D3C83_298320 [compost metagenome]